VFVWQRRDHPQINSNSLGRIVCPSLLRRLAAEGIADKELSALLARELLVPMSTTRRMKLSAKSAPCSAREVA
jgi:hypothetical protein